VLLLASWDFWVSCSPWPCVLLPTPRSSWICDASLMPDSCCLREAWSGICWVWEALAPSIGILGHWLFTKSECCTHCPASADGPTSSRVSARGETLETPERSSQALS
jgi:hypothetical protein